MASYYAPKPHRPPPAAYTAPPASPDPGFGYNAYNAPGTSPQTSSPARRVYNFTLGPRDRPVQNRRYPDFGEIAIMALLFALGYVLAYIGIMLLWWACCQDRMRVQGWMHQNWVGELVFFFVVLAVGVGVMAAVESKRRRR